MDPLAGLPAGWVLALEPVGINQYPELVLIGNALLTIAYAAAAGGICCWTWKRNLGWRPRLVLVTLLFAGGASAFGDCVEGLLLGPTYWNAFMKVVLGAAMVLIVIKGWESLAQSTCSMEELEMKNDALSKEIEQRKAVEIKSEQILTQQKLAELEIVRLNEDLQTSLDQLADAYGELQSLMEKLTQARDQAIEASRLKSEFLANMSHEIRTPLNGVIGMSDLLIRSKDPAEQREYAGIMRDSARALLAIVDDVLDFSKIEAGRMKLEIIDFDVVHLVESTAQILSERAHQKGISLMTYVGPDLPAIMRGDPDRIRQVLSNILDNAIKFTHNGEVVARVEVKTNYDGEPFVHYAVTDTGIGMPESATQHVFKPFTQADGSITRRFGGSGLGLAISTRLVEMMGGQIGARSREREGSTFWFDLPLEAGTGVSGYQVNPGGLSGQRAIVMSPHTRTADLLCRYLSDWGAECVTSCDSEKGFQILDKAADLNRPFDYAFIDSGFSDDGAFGVARLVRAFEKLHRVKLILLLPTSIQEQCQRALDNGFCACVVLPTTQEQLIIAMGKQSALATTADIHTPVESALTVTIMPSASDVDNLVLVVEDSTINQKVAVLQLKHLGIQAEVVANGREALDAVSSRPYSLILMDCQMPEMDGFEATRAIRKAEILAGRHTPIVAMTAHALESEREHCLAEGMDDYLSKPITPDRLKAVLDRWLTGTNKHERRSQAS